MPHLPKKLAPVPAFVASILLPQDPVSRLYNATDIANAINVAADVDGNDAIDAGVDTTLLLRAFAYEREGDYEAPYNLLGHGGSRSILCVRREMKHGRKWGNKFFLSIVRFNSIDATKKARVVRWNLRRPGTMISSPAPGAASSLSALGLGAAAGATTASSLFPVRTMGVRRPVTTIASPALGAASSLSAPGPGTAAGTTTASSSFEVSGRSARRPSTTISSSG